MEHLQPKTPAWIFFSLGHRLEPKTPATNRKSLYWGQDLEPKTGRKPHIVVLAHAGAPHQTQDTGNTRTSPYRLLVCSSPCPRPRPPPPLPPALQRMRIRNDRCPAHRTPSPPANGLAVMFKRLVTAFLDYLHFTNVHGGRVCLRLAAFAA